MHIPLVYYFTLPCRSSREALRAHKYHIRQITCEYMYHIGCFIILHQSQYKWSNVLLIVLI